MMEELIRWLDSQADIMHELSGKGRNSSTVLMAAGQEQAFLTVLDWIGNHRRSPEQDARMRPVHELRIADYSDKSSLYPLDQRDVERFDGESMHPQESP